MKIASPLAFLKGALKLVYPLLIAAGGTIASTVVVTGVGFLSGSLVALMLPVPVPFAAIGAVVAFISHIWRQA